MSNIVYLMFFIFFGLIMIQLLASYYPEFNIFLIRFINATENTITNVIPRILELWRKIKKYKLVKSKGING